MAQLAKKPYPMRQFAVGDNFDEVHTAQKAELDKLQAAADKLKPGEIVGGLLRFPRGDGYALYVVVKDKPLTLQHVPFGDAWQVDHVTIRGLRRGDVEAQLESERRLKKLFAKR
jgi:hypothetical protein